MFWMYKMSGTIPNQNPVKKTALIRIAIASLLYLILTPSINSVSYGFWGMFSEVFDRSRILAIILIIMLVFAWYFIFNLLYETLLKISENADKKNLIIILIFLTLILLYALLGTRHSLLALFIGSKENKSVFSFLSYLLGLAITIFVYIRNRG